MRKIIACSTIAIIASTPLAYAQTYKTTSQNPAVNQLHTTPSIMDEDGNINSDPAMTSSTTSTGPSKTAPNGIIKCQTGKASSNNPDNTDNPAVELPCQP